MFVMVNSWFIRNKEAIYLPLTEFKWSKLKRLCSHQDIDVYFQLLFCAIGILHVYDSSDLFALVSEAWSLLY